MPDNILILELFLFKSIRILDATYSVIGFYWDKLGLIKVAKARSWPSNAKRKLHFDIARVLTKIAFIIIYIYIYIFQSTQ